MVIDAMKLKHAVSVAVALLVTTAAVVAGESDNPQMGTWKLDEAKSKMPADGVKNTTVAYTKGEKGMIKLSVEGTDKDGKATHWTWMGKFDGNQNKVEGSDMMDSMALKKMSSHLNQMTIMKDGKVVITGTIKVAKDGKSRVVTNSGTNPDGKKMMSTAYYNKE